MVAGADAGMTLEELARACVAHPRWRWLAGMKVLNGFRVTESLLFCMHDSDLPDLTDPSTGGAMLDVLGEEHRWRVDITRMGFTAFWVRNGDELIVCDTLAEACAHVLLSVPTEVE